MGIDHGFLKTRLVFVGATLPLPAKWVPMKKDEDFRVVYIDNKSQEFKDIEKEFIDQVTKGPYSNKVPNNKNIKVVKVDSTLTVLLQKILIVICPVINLEFEKLGLLKRNASTSCRLKGKQCRP